MVGRGEVEDTTGGGVEEAETVHTPRMVDPIDNKTMERGMGPMTMSDVEEEEGGVVGEGGTIMEIRAEEDIMGAQR